MSELSSSGELDHLVAERVWQELRSALTERNPAIFFMVLHACGAIETLFPEIANGLHCANPSKLLPLDLATELTDDIKILFAVLASLVVHAETIDKKTAVTSSQLTDFCARLKVPATYRKLAEQVAIFSDQTMTVFERPVGATVDLILSLQGLRNHEHFEQCLQASQVTLTAVGWDRVQVEQNIRRLRLCRDRMQQTDIESFTKAHQGNDLASQVRELYAQAITELIGPGQD